MDDERPVPVIIIRDWDTEDMNFHNSAYSGENGTGNNYERYLTFDWKTTVEFLVRDDDEVGVSEKKENLKRELRLISENPLNFHDNLKNCIVGADGNPTHQFTEPKEAELMASATFHGDHTITLTNSDLTDDTLEQVLKEFTFNP